MTTKTRQYVHALFFGAIFGTLGFGLISGAVSVFELWTATDLSTGAALLTACLLGITAARKLSADPRPRYHSTAVLYSDLLFAASGLFAGGAVSALFASTAWRYLLPLFVPTCFICGVCIFILINQEDFLSMQLPAQDAKEKPDNRVGIL